MLLELLISVKLSAEAMVCRSSLFRPPSRVRSHCPTPPFPSFRLACAVPEELGGDISLVSDSGVGRKRRKSKSEKGFKPTLTAKVKTHLGHLRDGDEAYDSSVVKICGCQYGPDELIPTWSAADFVISSPNQINAFAAHARQAGIGLREAVEGSAFESATGVAFPGSHNPMVLALLDDCRAAEASGQVKVICLVGMLCGKDKEARCFPPAASLLI